MLRRWLLTLLALSTSVGLAVGLAGLSTGAVATQVALSAHPNGVIYGPPIIE